MAPGALTCETVSGKVSFTEEERTITANNRTHLCAKHCSHLIFVTALCT